MSNDRDASPKVTAGRTRRGGHRSGQALVELVLGGIILVVFLFGAFELGRHYYARHTVRRHVAEAARLAAAGQSLVNPDTGEQMNRAESVAYFIESSVGSAPVQLESVKLEPEDGGKPGELVRIIARYRFSFFSAPLVRAWVPETLIFTVTTVVKNEAAPKATSGTATPAPAPEPDPIAVSR